MKSLTLFSAWKNCLVLMSEGKIVVVAPVSAPMFAIVDLSDNDKVFTPGPKNSRIFPFPPSTLILFRISRITSLAVDHGFSLFFN